MHGEFLLLDKTNISFYNDKHETVHGQYLLEGKIMKKESWTRKETAELLDKMPARTVQFYSEQPGLLPDLERYVGRGKVRKYSRNDLVTLKVIKELVFYGMTVGKISAIFNTWRSLYQDWWDKDDKEEGFLIVHRLLGEREGIAVEFRHESKLDWQGVRSALVIDIGRLLAELEI
jgi:DNA-binding transcriptional MerR regulator